VSFAIGRYLPSTCITQIVCNIEIHDNLQGDLDTGVRTDHVYYQNLVKRHPN